MRILFWLCWSAILIFVLVILWNQLRMYSERAMTPLNPGAWRQGWFYVGLGSTLLVAGMVVRYALNMPKLSAWIIASPVLGVAGWMLIMMLAILFGSRVN